MRYLVFILLFLIVNSVFSQITSKLIVIDAVEKSPLIGAHVCVVPASGNAKYYSANIDGEVIIEFENQAEVTVSYIGYLTKKIPVQLGENRTILLKPDLLELNQVIVTATVKPQKVDQSIYKVGVVSAKVMEKQGVQNMRDALRFQPNINLLEDGVLGSQIIMQGLNGEYVKFLIDGMPIIGRQAGNIDLSQIDLSQVDHIEVIEGPLSVVYGSNALAGTINIITKQNKYYKWSGSATAYAESVGQYNGNLGLQGKQGNSKYGFSGGYRYFEGHDLDSSTRSMNWNPKNQINSEVFYGLTFLGWDTKIGVRGSREDLDYKTNYLVPYRALDTKYITDRISYYGNFNKQINENNVFTSLVSFNTYTRTSQDYVVKEDLNTIDKKGESEQDVFNTINARFSYAYQLINWLQWQAGYELTDDSGAGEKIEGTEKMVENAIWTDFKINLSNQLIFQPGFRYMHHSKYDAPLIYSAHLKWNSKETTVARFSFANGFRAPSLKELYLDFVDTNHKIYGNSDLDAETSYNISAAVSKYFEFKENEGVKVEFSGFYNHLSDVIELTLDADGVSYYYQNVSEKKTKGGVFSVNYLKNFFNLSAGTVVTGIGYDLDENTDMIFSYSVDVNASTSYKWQKINLSAQLDYKYTGERVQLFSNEDEPVTKGTTAGYGMLNFSSTKGFHNNKFVLTAGIKNILDIENVLSTSTGVAHSDGSSRLIAWGRTFFISLKYNLNQI